MTFKVLSYCVGGFVGSKMRSQNFFDSRLQNSRFFIGREPHAYALRLIAGSLGRRDPCDFARDGVTLGFVGKREQNIDVVS